MEAHQSEVFIQAFQVLSIETTRARNAAATQIEEAKHASEGTTSACAVLVARNGRAPTAWLRALVASDEGATGYRTAALAPETLWRIVDDAGASATARAGAAVALRTRMRIDDEGRRRLRVASETCAAPALRVAFAAAADATNEAEVENALASVEDDTSAKAPRSRRSS